MSGFPIRHTRVSVSTDTRQTSSLMTMASQSRHPGREMTPDEAEILNVIAKRRDRIRSLPGWDATPDRVYDLLKIATRERAIEIDSGADDDTPWETLLGFLIAWHHELPTGEKEPDEGLISDIVLAAREITRLQTIEHGIRQGIYHVSPYAGGARLRWQRNRNVAIEAADMFLESQTRAVTPPGVSEAESRWISAKPAASRALPPPEVIRAAKGRALDEIETWRAALPEGVLPDDFPLEDGLDVRVMTQILAAVMGLASLCEYTARRQRRTETTLLRQPEAELYRLLSEVTDGVRDEQIVAAVERLSYRPGRSARSSPLVKHAGLVILCPPLLTPRATDVIMLRTAAESARSFGTVGRLQGQRASGWTDWLRAIPSVLVAEGVSARRADGQLAGDLDVVAIDPVRRVGLCIEVKWPIDAITWSEVARIDRTITSAAAQCARLRHELETGLAEVEMPESWPRFEDIEWTWCAGTAQQLTTVPMPVDDVHATSLRYLLALGTPTDLESLSKVLRDPSLPRYGRDFIKVRERNDIEGYSLDVEAIVLLKRAWAPTY
jgi:hypothetical protein